MSGPFGPLDAPLWDTNDALRFTGAGGIVWRVVECPAAGVPGARGPRCLVFLADGIARRVWTYPPDWRLLSPVELEALTVVHR